MIIFALYFLWELISSDNWYYRQELLNIISIFKYKIQVFLDSLTFACQRNHIFFWFWQSWHGPMQCRSKAHNACYFKTALNSSQFAYSTTCKVFRHVVWSKDLFHCICKLQPLSNNEHEFDIWQGNIFWTHCLDLIYSFHFEAPDLG